MSTVFWPYKVIIIMDDLLGGGAKCRWSEVSRVKKYWADMSKNLGRSVWAETSLGRSGFGPKCLWAEVSDIRGIIGREYSWNTVPTCIL